MIRGHQLVGDLDLQQVHLPQARLRRIARRPQASAGAGMRVTFDAVATSRIASSANLPKP
jgi:hypothetical protein